MTTARLYRPVHQKQKLRTASGSLYGCTDTTTAMFADAVTVGAVKITEAGVRKMSSEPIPDPASPGLNIPQAIAVLWKLRIGCADASGQDFDALLRYLNHGSGRRIIFQHDLYYLKDGTGGKHVGHCMLLQAQRVIDGKQMILGNNPMMTGAHWYTIAELKAAGEAFGKQSGVANNGVRFAISKVVPMIAV